MSQTHWAAALIGRPYRRGAQGPAEFDCWGLVRHVFAHEFGIDMPIVPVGASGQAGAAAAIREAAAVSGWRPTYDRLPAEHDVVLMQGLDGPHVGVIVRDGAQLLLLHAFERVGVCAQPLADVARAGFHGFTFWRRVPAEA